MSFYQQTVIAVIWDFDKTLIPGSMQDPLLQSRGISPISFWNEVNVLSERYRERGTVVAQGTAYLNHLLTYVRTGRLAGLTNADLEAAGRLLTFYEGVPEVFDRLTAIPKEPAFEKHEIHLEHYVVSTGLRRIVKGSVIGQKVRDIWASEYIDDVIIPGPQAALPAPLKEIAQIGYTIDDTTKTRALFEINKGTNDNPKISINGTMRPEERRVPFENMICVADGPSDVPMFSVLRQYGGKTFAVYDPLSPAHFGQVAQLQEQDRVMATFPADYREDTAASRWLDRAVRQIAQAIVAKRDRMAAGLAESAPPSHVVDEPVRIAERSRPGFEDGAARTEVESASAIDPRASAS